MSAEQLENDYDPEGDPDEQGIARALTDDDLGEPLPPPHLTGNNSDRELLAQQQIIDHSLYSLREWADKGKSEYSWKDGVLVYTLEDEGGETSVRIVVPVDRRTQVMRLAHSTFTGGYFSHKKTSAVLKTLFTWSGISWDVQNWCSTCPHCHKAAKHTGPKAPLKPLP